MKIMKKIFLTVIIIGLFSACGKINEAQIEKALSKIYYAKDAVLNNVMVFFIDQHSLGVKEYVGNFSKDDSAVTFTVNVPVSNNYDIVISSAANYGKGQKINNVFVNGKQIGEITTPEKNVFSENVIRHIYLEKGDNEITVKKNWGWIYLNYLRIKNSDDLKAYNVSSELINPNASDSAKRLMKYITDIYGKKTLSGQSGGGVDSGEFRAVYSVTKKYPAIMMLDMMDYSPTRVMYGTRSNAVEEAIEWHDMGGIVKFLWHWNAPKDLINNDEHKWWSGFYTNAVTFDLAKAMSKEDEEGYNLLLRDIDEIAEQFKRLQALDIPVLWRPLHEAAGSWFWWGAYGPEVYKELWVLLYERLTLHHGLNNLIWIWNGEDKDWFPGANYVDLVGADIYAPKRDYSSQASKFYEIVECLAELGTMKAIGMTECGTLPDINEMERDKAMWFMFATWNSDFVQKRVDGSYTGEYSQEYTEAAQLKMMYDSEKVVTLEDLPDLKNYPLK